MISQSKLHQIGCNHSCLQKWHDNYLELWIDTIFCLLIIILKTDGKKYSNLHFSCCLYNHGIIKIEKDHEEHVVYLLTHVHQAIP